MMEQPSHLTLTRESEKGEKRLVVALNLATKMMEKVENLILRDGNYSPIIHNATEFVSLSSYH